MNASEAHQPVKSPILDRFEEFIHAAQECYLAVDGKRPLDRIEGQQAAWLCKSFQVIDPILAIASRRAEQNSAAV